MQHSPSRALAVLAVAVGALCALTSPPLGAASLDEVLDRHIAARGGKAAWAKVQGLRLSGSYTAFSKPGPATVVRTRTGYRADVTWNEQPVTIAWNGQDAWTTNLFMGNTWPAPIGGQDRIALELELDFPNPLFVAREKGYTLSLDEKANFDGQPTVAVKLTRPSGEHETWHLDPKTWLEVAREAPASEFGRPDRQITFFDDFRKVGDLMLPHFSESQWYTRTWILRVEKVEVDPTLPASHFDRPAPPGMESLAALAGDWVVKTERRRSPDAPWTEGERKSKISVRLHGALVEDSFITERGTPVVMSMSFDPYRQRYRFTAINEASPHLDVLEGVKTAEGKIVVDNLVSKTSQLRGDVEVFSRMSWVGVTPEGFVLENEISRDGGATWFNDARFTYRRATAP